MANEKEVLEKEAVMKWYEESKYPYELWAKSMLRKLCSRFTPPKVVKLPEKKDEYGGTYADVQQAIGWNMCLAAVERMNGGQDEIHP